jgi:acetyl-CoA carboxylase biotin carboxyl carrier protein
MTMTDLGFELEEIAQLIKMVEQRGLSELIVEEGDRSVIIRGIGYRRHGTPANAVQVLAPAVADGYTEGEAAVAVAEAPAAVDHRVPVASPMVGVFYRSAAPDTAPYVEIGDRVEVGQTVGMIEAMKVFSEIPSDHAGRVAEIVAHNGQLVKPQEPLLYLIPDSQ